MNHIFQATVLVSVAVCVMGCSKSDSKPEKKAAANPSAATSTADAPKKDVTMQQTADYMDALCELSTLHASCLRRLKLPKADVPPSRFDVAFAVLDVDGTKNNIHILEKPVGTLDDLTSLDEHIEKASEHTRSLLFRAQREGEPVRWVVAIDANVKLTRLQEMFNLLFTHGIETFEALVQCAHPQRPPALPAGDDIAKLMKLPLSGSPNSMVNRLNQTCNDMVLLMDAQATMHPSMRCEHLKEKLPEILATEVCAKDRDAILAILQKIAIPSKITGLIPMTLTPDGPMSKSAEISWGEFVAASANAKKGAISVSATQKQ
ncbi:MAG: hypothetical protein JXR76_10460 [Deltaproteobacteria bacterium]|nr:hypothetical protein [Deltaproteobacteria bacterium]